MKKLMFAVAGMLFATGCSTVIMSSPGTLKSIDVQGATDKPERVVMVSNAGFYLFHTFPIVCGSMQWDDKLHGVEQNIAMFSDDLSLDRMMKVLYKYAEYYNCNICDVVINDKSEAMVGFFGIPDWIATVAGRREYAVSAVLCPNKK